MAKATGVPLSTAVGLQLCSALVVLAPEYLLVLVLRADCGLEVKEKDYIHGTSFPGLKG